MKHLRLILDIVEILYQIAVVIQQILSAGQIT